MTRHIGHIVTPNLVPKTDHEKTFTAAKTTNNNKQQQQQQH